MLGKHWRIFLLKPSTFYEWGSCEANKNIKTWNSNTPNAQRVGANMINVVKNKLSWAKEVSQTSLLFFPRGRKKLFRKHPFNGRLCRLHLLFLFIQRSWNLLNTTASLSASTAQYLSQPAVLARKRPHKQEYHFLFNYSSTITYRDLCPPLENNDSCPERAVEAPKSLIPSHLSKSSQEAHKWGSLEQEE